MSDAPRLCANLIVWNEIDFIEAYLENTLPYVDTLIVIDGGSTDGTLEVLRAADPSKVDLTVWQQPGGRNTEGWQEPQRRNLAIEKSIGDWILKKDADEFFCEDDYLVIRELMTTDAHAFRFHTYHFWGGVDRLRLDSPGDEHWSNEWHLLMWRASLGLRYTDVPLHSTLSPAPDARFVPDVHMHHYHWALGTKVKVNDLRRGDLVADRSILPPEHIDQSLDPGDIVWDLPHVITTPFAGPHPRAIMKATDRLGRRESV